MTLLEDVRVQTSDRRSVAVLKTERLMLRAPRGGDAHAMTQLAGDRRVAVNTARIPHPYRIDDAEQFIAAVNRHAGEVVFVITLDEVLIGACGIHPCQSEPEIGYWLGVPYWGNGYATEAVRAVIDHAFGALRHEALLAGARVSNPASRRVLEKCGFQWTGVQLTRVRAINSAAPTDRFRLDRKLWESLKAWGRLDGVA
jgi:RimJ/RimL family protein N-acetyltransferase